MKPIFQISFQHFKNVLGILCFAVIVFQFASCDQPVPQQGGRIEATPNVEFNGRVVSPIIIVPPLLTCGKSVTVKGFVPQARIRIYSGTTEIGGGIGIDPEGQTFPISPELTAPPQLITATQEFDGVESDAASTAVNVQAVNDVYPAGLPRPVFPALHLYNCGVATVVSNLPNGGTVKVFERAPVNAIPGPIVGQIDGVSEAVSIGIGPAFQENDIVTSKSQICALESDYAEEQTVRPAPTSLPTPHVTGIYDGGTIMTVDQLVNGAKVTIKRAGITLSGGGAPASHVRFPLNDVVHDGEVIEIIQELCGVNSPTGTVTVQPCSSLPPARLLAPRPGDIVVYLTDVVAGSRIRIFSAGQEIGDGGGSAIQLTRPLVLNETLVVIQSIGTCVSASSYVLEVGHGLNDPLVAGTCGGVESFEYGQSNDPERQTTDISDYFNSPDQDVTVPMDAVPLHGVVRYPSGPGPFPIVLIVHGNHDPLDASYPGYDYLLDHLASHCMIAVSVEEDFLNGNTSGEMDARGIVLLRHLQLWREWSRTPGHRFYGKVDMGRVGLAGHSRGGEAIVAAHLQNYTRHNPSDPAHNFNFGIRSLYAIAPVDGQYDDGPITLNGADYYVMHGSHDGDVADFGGHRQYDRAFPVSGSTNNFKGLLFIHGANHAFWNTSWDHERIHVGPAASELSRGDQELIGKSYLTAFYLASLKGWNSYRYFLNGEVTFSSLPSSITRVFQYQDPKRVFINHYEEDDDMASGSFAGVANSTSGTFEKYEDRNFNDKQTGNHMWGETDGAIAAWRDVENAEIHIRLPRELQSTIHEYEFLAFRICQTLEDTPSLNSPGINKDVSVQALMGTSPLMEVQTSGYYNLFYPMVTTGNPSWGGAKSVLQTIRIPLKDLVREPAEIENITEIVLKFNRHPKGIVAIDEVQFTD
jgi:hypothetical protein